MSEGQEKPGSCKERAFSVALLACTLAFRPPRRWEPRVVIVRAALAKQFRGSRSDTAGRPAAVLLGGCKGRSRGTPP